MIHKLGGHLSVAGGYYNALNKTVDIGGNCLQIFSSSPRSWNFEPPADDQVELFVKLKEKLAIDPVYIHASYLINLANVPTTVKNSIDTLVRDLKTSVGMKIKGVIVHLGSFKGSEADYANLVANIKIVLEETPEESIFIIENAGNKKIGKDLVEIAKIMEGVNSNRVRVCLDTCHLYSAGYDLSTRDKLDNFLIAFDSLIGLKKLDVWHINDSRDPFNSGRDRHANIGEGTLGLETFRLLLNHPKTEHHPFIIEVPGFDDKGPDKKNIDILKSLIQ